MNEYDPQAANEADVVDVVTTVQEHGMVHLWQAVTEQIADPEAMRRVCDDGADPPRCRQDVHEAAQMSNALNLSLDANASPVALARRPSWRRLG